MQDLPDCKKRWADMEDTGTPSPWTEYPLPEFKTLWPETPTPLDAFCDPTHHIKNPVFMELAEKFPQLNATAVQDDEGAIMVQHNATVQEDFTAFSQISTSLSDALDSCTAGPFEGSCVVLAQTCPALSETQIAVVPCALSVSFQQNCQDDAMKLQTEMEKTHCSGQCRPCAWFWRPSGCRNGEECGYCHLCPEGELKSRKKTKIAAMRMGALTPLKEASQNSGGWGLKLDSLIHDERD
jgi:hypothetical protein